MLFLIIFVWTPPHFWALALYRCQDYARVGVPMLPVVAGAEKTRQHILGYTLVLVPVSLLPWGLGLAGPLYGLAALALGVGFVAHARPALARPHPARARCATFRYSIVYLFALFFALVVDKALGASGARLVMAERGATAPARQEHRARADPGGAGRAVLPDHDRQDDRHAP